MSRLRSGCNDELWAWVFLHVPLSEAIHLSCLHVLGPGTGAPDTNCIVRFFAQCVSYVNCSACFKRLHDFFMFSTMLTWQLLFRVSWVNVAHVLHVWRAFICSPVMCFDRLTCILLYSLSQQRTSHSLRIRTTLTCRQAGAAISQS